MAYFAVRMGFELSVLLKGESLTDWLWWLAIGFWSGTDEGTRTPTKISLQRILSPLRLPFRHIGLCPAVAGVLPTESVSC